MASSSVLCLPRNRVGRDFIVGDVGGSFDQVFQAMQDVDFDSSRDRLISVGHLLAGQASLTSCIRFLRTPSVYAVLSNGEQDLIDLFADGPPDDDAVEALAALDYHGMAWLARAGHLQRAQLVAAMRLLPLAISIGDAVADTGYVHAGLPLGEDWEGFMSGLRRGEDHCTWAALRGAAGDCQVSGVERVFMCYTPDWDLSHCHANMVAVPPGPVVRLISDMMVVPKLVEGQEAVKK